MVVVQPGRRGYYPTQANLARYGENLLSPAPNRPLRQGLAVGKRTPLRCDQRRDEAPVQKEVTAVNNETKIDPLARRVEELRKHEVGAIAPQLALLEELLEDARRQYDFTAAAVLTQVRQRFVERLEQAVDTERWVSVRQAARMVNRPEGTVRYWCRNTLVDARRVGARDWEIDRQSLLKRAAA